MDILSLPPERLAGPEPLASGGEHLGISHG